jgi:gamma-glutamyltranspeptidase/glutathione hydrolase
MRLADVLEPAIGYAEHGYPAVPGIADTIQHVEPLLREWPASAELYLPPPVPGRLHANPQLAATYRRIVDDSRGVSRDSELERAHDVWYRGFVAEAMVGFSESEGGLLSESDLADWRPTLEPPATFDFRGHTVCKTAPWGQGPVFLQQLSLLDGFDLESMGLRSADYVHTVVECAKLAFADREAFYGDPEFVDVPLDRLLSRAYADERRALVGAEASTELRPGGGRLPPQLGTAPELAGSGEPTRGDTVHVDVVDRFGNVFSATPSGGWLQSSPVIGALGFPLGTRAQMFWLADGHPSSLAPRKRPRTTLSPSLCLRGGDPYLAFGTPGGDQQDQWTLAVFLAHVVFGLDLQAAIDEPCFHTNHFPSSFYPRTAEPRVVEIESRFDSGVIAELRRRGHDVRVEGPWALGRVSAAGREADGVLKAAANSRGMQGYAVGR